MSFPRLSGIAALGIIAVVASGCASEEPVAVGIDSLHLATLGSVDPSQQAFIDRMNELSEGTVDLEVTENWSGGGGDSDEVALTKAVVAVMAEAIAGKTRADVARAGAELEDMLAGAAVLPSGDWARLAILAPVRDYKARHNSILLPFEAVEKAFHSRSK